MADGEFKFLLNSTKLNLVYERKDFLVLFNKHIHPISGYIIIWTFMTMEIISLYYHLVRVHFDSCLTPNGFPGAVPEVFFAILSKCITVKHQQLMLMSRGYQLIMIF